MQDCELAPGETKGLAILLNLLGRGIEREIAPFEQRAGSPCRTPNQGSQASCHLLKIERLAEIVIGAGVEAENPVRHLIACCQKHDGRMVNACTPSVDPLHPGTL